MIVGSGKYQYRLIEGWGHGPEGLEDFGQAVDVAIDSQDRVYVVSRNPQPRVLLFDPQGRLLTSWGETVFTVLGGIHGIWIGNEDQVYCTDALDHAVHQFTPEGELLHTLGAPGQPGAPGAPFNKPTQAALGPGGEILVADGYGQERVHRFAPDGKRLCSWGSKGSDPGQFDTPHAVWVDPQGRVLVADRANDRIQVFDGAGELLDIWTGLSWPNAIYIDSNGEVYVAEAYGGISVFDLQGKLQVRWGKEEGQPSPFADMPHGLCVDSQGDLYVAEVLPPNLLHKFKRL